MATALFVHGTGVRKEQYEATLELIREGLTMLDLPQLTVEAAIPAHNIRAL